MAKPSWLTIVPTGGSGNATINNTADTHTGRIVRTGVVTVTGAGVATPVTYKVTQEALSEFVSFDNGTEMAVAVTGGNVTIVGKSNSSKLEFDWIIPDGSSEPEIDANGNTSFEGIDFPTVRIPDVYLAGGQETENNNTIEGDPGATSAFTFSIDLVFPDNTALVDVYRTLSVKANGSQAAQIVIKQTADSAYIRLSVHEIIIPQEGGTVSIEVISNTDWSVS